MNISVLNYVILTD